MIGSLVAEHLDSATDSPANASACQTKPIPSCPTDDLIVSAFKAFDEEVEEKIKGQMVRRHILEVENFKHVLTTFSDTLNEEEMDDIFGEFEFDDDGNILTKSVVDLFVPGAMDEKEEEEEKKEEEKKEGDAPPEEGTQKKKKKKKKAAK